MGLLGVDKKIEKLIDEKALSEALVNTFMTRFEKLLADNKVTLIVERKDK